MRSLIPAVLLLLLMAGAAGASSADCRDCHKAEFDLWAASHHALAERPLKPSLDARAFAPPRDVRAGTQTNIVQLRSNVFQIVTRGLHTNAQAFAVDRVLGVEPLREFLTPWPGGRWQVQELAYDPGSNVWFDVFGDEDRQPGEWGQWTGRGMNWNSMCAECHNTTLRKDYEPASDTYHTTMDEMGVGCASCHSGMEKHLAWQRAHPGSQAAEPGLVSLTTAATIDNCGSCHARREDITGTFAPGEAFYDHYQLQIVDESDTYYADGQVHGEDYEFASFKSSKMSRRGVTCMDCHNPHSLKRLATGNDLCMRCHRGAYPNAPVIDPLAHSHHPAGSGNQCVECHMPVTVYMQRHARRDHGFTIPDPLLTQEWNIPNACNRCHTEKPVEWTLAATEKWYGTNMERWTRQRARIIAAAQQEQDAAEGPLIQILQSETNGYWRGVAAGLLWHWCTESNAQSALVSALRDNYPLVRAKAAASLEPAMDADPLVRRALGSLLNDPVRAVRLSAAWDLRATIDPQSGPGRDLQRMIDYISDQPAGQFRKAQFQLARGQTAGALESLRVAEKWDPFSPPIHQGLAEVLDDLGKTNEAAEELKLSRQNPP